MKAPTLFFLLFCISRLCAQDGVYTQMLSAPLSLNPALTGMDCGPRFASVFRYQDSHREYFQSDYYIIAASFDLPIHLKNGDRIGIGARGDFEQFTPVTYRHWVGGISLSYQKRIFKNSRHSHSLVAGLEGGLARKSLDTMAARLVDPFNPPVRNHFYFPDFSGGLGYQLVRENGDKITAGISATHLGRPKQMQFYFDRSYPLDVRFLVHGNAEFGLSPRLGLSPWIVFYYVYEDYNWGDLGTDFVISFDKGRRRSVAIGAGLKECFFHDSDFLINYLVLSGGVSWNRFSLRFTQDLNIRYDEAPNPFEVFLIYRHCKPGSR